MFKPLQIISSIVLGTLLLIGAQWGSVFAYTDDTTFDVELNVNGCNNNGLCEAVIGEDILSCPLDCTPVITSGGLSSGSIPNARKDFFQNIVIVPSTTGAIITWTSNIPSITSVRWGTTPEVREGTLRSVLFKNTHRAELVGLTPGVVYYISIEAQDAQRTIAVSALQTFMTSPVPNTIAPQNPSNLTATAMPDGVFLSWENSTEEDFSYVRIMRNEDRFHTGPYVGVLLYEGNEERFIDSSAVAGKRYYYSLFSRDSAGNFSSGAGASAMIPLPSGIESPTPTPVQSIEPLFPRFTIIQERKELSFSQNSVPIKNATPFVLEGIPGALRGSEDAWIEIQSPSGEKTTQYLFAYDPKKDVYGTQIPMLKEGGTHTFSIYGYADGRVAKLGEGTFQVAFPIDSAASREGMSLSMTLLLKSFIEIILILILLFLVLRVKRHLEQ